MSVLHFSLSCCYLGILLAGSALSLEYSKVTSGGFKGGGGGGGGGVEGARPPLNIRMIKKRRFERNEIPYCSEAS